LPAVGGDFDNDGICGNDCPTEFDPLADVAVVVDGELGFVGKLVAIRIGFQCACPQQEATEHACQQEEGEESGRPRLDHYRVDGMGWIKRCG